MKFINILGAILIGSGLIYSQDADGNGIPDTYETALAQQFSPIAHYHINNPLFPMSVNSVYTENDFINSTDGWVPLPVTTHDPVHWAQYFFDVLSGEQPTIYYNVMQQAIDSYIYTVVQYWFYYPFNDASNIHEGDWEHIAILLDGYVPGTAQPMGAIYQRHGVLDRFSWNFLEKTGDHPHVYVGGHTKMKLDLLRWTRENDCNIGGFAEVTGACYTRSGIHYSAGKKTIPVSGSVKIKATFDETIIPDRTLSDADYQLINARDPNNSDLWWKNYPGYYYGVNPSTNSDMSNAVCQDIVTIFGNLFTNMEVSYPVIMGTPGSMMCYYNNYPIDGNTGDIDFCTLRSDNIIFSHNFVFNLLTDATVNITIKNILGNCIISFTSDFETGVNKFQWNWLSDGGNLQSSGWYKYLITTSPNALFNYYNYFGKRERSSSYSNKYGLTDLGGTLIIDEEIAIESGSTIGLTNQYHNVRTVNAKFNNWEGSGINYLHQKWNDNIESYLLENDFDIYTEPDQLANYGIPEQINFLSTTDVSETYLIQDPWFVDQNGIRSGNVWIQIDSSQYQMFLNQNPDFTLSNPIYSLRAPHLAGVVNNGIYVFKAWRVYEPDGTTQDVNGSYAVLGDSTNYDSCAVVFKQAAAVVKLVYEAVNTQPNTTLTIDAGDSLVIPAGANIHFADKFSLRVRGALIADGTSGAIALTGSGRNTTINYHGQERPPVPDSWLIQIDDTQADLFMKNVTIDNTYGGVSIADFSSAILKDVTISRTNQGIGLGKMVNDRILFSNVHLSNSHNGVVFPAGFENVDQESSVLFYRCLFTDIEDHGLFIYQEIPVTANTNINISIYNCDFYLNGDDGVKISTLGGLNFADINMEVHNSIYSYSQFIYNLNGLTLHGFCNIFHSSGTIPAGNAGPIAEITSDPLFMDPISGDFHLQGTSPAIDQGVSGIYMNAFPEYEVNEDPDFTDPDIGAYYFDKIPAAPTNFSVSGAIGQHPQLSWTLPLDQDIQAIEVYRRLTNEGSYYPLLVSLGSNQTTYTDYEIYITSGNRFTPSACYKVKAVDNINQSSAYTSIICKPYVAGKEMVLDETIIPDVYGLHNAFPNPFNPVTTIRYDLPEYSRVLIKIYNTLGQLVATPLNDDLSAGYRSLQWNGTDDNADAVASGVYLYTISAQSLESDKTFTDKKKMILLK